MTGMSSMWVVLGMSNQEDAPKMIHDMLLEICGLGWEQLRVWLNIFRLFPFAVIYIWGVTLCSRISWLLYSHAVNASGSRKTTEQHTLVVNDNRYDIDSAMKRAAVQGCRVACRGTIAVGMLLHSSYIKKFILISSCCRATLWLSLAEETRMHHNDFLVE